MTFRFLSPFVIALVTGSLLAACAGTQGPPVGAHYAIEKRFQRPIDADTLGIRVSDGLTSGSMSSDQVKHLSIRLADVLRESGHFGVVIDLTSGDHDGGLDMTLGVSVTEFQNASKQERQQGVRSRLVGELTLTDRQGNNRGTARVESDGMSLDVIRRMDAPDTLRFFAEAILELLQ